MFTDFFGGQLNIETYLLEIFIGNQLIQKQQISGPVEMIQAQFIGLIQDICSKGQKMKVRLSKNIEIFDNFENTTKTIPAYIEFYNWKD